MRDIGQILYGFGSEKAMFDALDKESERTYSDSATIFKELGPLVMDYIIQYGYNNFDTLYTANLIYRNC